MAGKHTADPAEIMRATGHPELEYAAGWTIAGLVTIGAIVGGWHALGLPAYSLGYVDLAIFAAMMPTIMIAAPIGVRVGHMLSETWLRRIYTVLLFVIAVDLIRKLTI